MSKIIRTGTDEHYNDYYELSPADYNRLQRAHHSFDLACHRFFVRHLCPADYIAKLDKDERKRIEDDLAELNAAEKRYDAVLEELVGRDPQSGRFTGIETDETPFHKSHNGNYYANYFNLSKGYYPDAQWTDYNQQLKDAYELSIASIAIRIVILATLTGAVWYFASGPFAFVYASMTMGFWGISMSNRKSVDEAKRLAQLRIEELIPVPKLDFTVHPYRAIRAELPN